MSSNTSLLYLLLVVLFTSCADSYSSCDPMKESDRTLIVYMGGDNNLSNETYDKIAAIQKVVSTDKRFAEGGGYELLIFQDPSKNSGATPKLLRAHYGQLQPEVVYEYESENSASAELLARVIDQCKTLAPADSYALWVFSHASGWLPNGTLTSPRSKSIIVDGADEMDIKDFAHALKQAEFEFIIFEACFMAAIETTYELKDKTNYILASSAEMLSPGMTDIYASVLPQAMEGNLTNVAKIYFNHWNTQLQESSRAATVSLLKTAELDQLAAVVKDIRATGTEVDISTIQHFDRNATYKLFFDFEDYFSRLATPTQALKLKTALEKVVMYQAATPSFLLQEQQKGFVINKHSGLTVYIEQPRFNYINNEHQKLRWAQAIAIGSWGQ